LGSDPEFVCQNTQTGEFVSLVGFIPGTKKNPEPIELGCGVQLDNVGCEITVPPCENFKELMYYIDSSRNNMDNFLKSINPHWKLRALSSAIFDPKELKSKGARTFGCDPSYSIYKGVSERPSAKEVGNLRSFGFHIHFGIEDFKEEDIVPFIFLCDLFLGIPSIIEDPDKNRRKIYGNLGDYRKTSYGIEYRTMGSYMMAKEEVVSDGINKIIETLKEPERINLLLDKYFDVFEKIDREIKNEDLNLEEIEAIYKYEK